MTVQRIDVIDESGKDPWPDPPPPPPPRIAHPAGSWAAHTSAFGPTGSGDADSIPVVTAIHQQ